LETSKNFGKALIIALVVVILFKVMVTPDFANRGDYQFHYEKSAGLNDRPYAPLTSMIGQLFGYSEGVFFFFILLLVGLITPLLLWHVTRTWQTVLFYYATQYFWFMFSTVSQAVAGIFLVGLFVTKNNYLRLLFVALGAAAHGQGAILLTVAWLLIVVFEHRKEWNVFPACGSLFGNATPEIASTYLAGNPAFGVSIATVLNFFWKIIPFPFLFFGVKQLISDKNYAPLVISAFAVLGSVFASDRALYIVPLMILPFAGKYCANSSKRVKWGFYFLAIVLIGLQLYSWIRVKTACV